MISISIWNWISANLRKTKLRISSPRRVLPFRILWISIREPWRAKNFSPSWAIICPKYPKMRSPHNPSGGKWPETRCSSEAAPPTTSPSAVTCLPLGEGEQPHLPNLHRPMWVSTHQNRSLFLPKRRDSSLFAGCPNKTSKVDPK